MFFVEHSSTVQVRHSSNYLLASNSLNLVRHLSFSRTCFFRNYMFLGEGCSPLKMLL